MADSSNNKRKGRKRALVDELALNHFLAYFKKTLKHDPERFDAIKAAFTSIDIEQANELSYELIKIEEYTAWAKAWYSYNKRNNHKQCYRYFLGTTENTVLKQLAEHPKYKGMSGEKILSQLVLSESMRLMQDD